MSERYSELQWFRDLSPEDQAFVTKFGRDALIKQKELEKQLKEAQTQEKPEQSQPIQTEETKTEDDEDLEKEAEEAQKLREEVAREIKQEKFLEKGQHLFAELEKRLSKEDADVSKLVEESNAKLAEYVQWKQAEIDRMASEAKKHLKTTTQILTDPLLKRYVNDFINILKDMVSNPQHNAEWEIRLFATKDGIELTKGNLTKPKDKEEEKA